MTLRVRLAAQAARSPDSVAAEDDRGALTFGQLHRRADGLAQVLLAMGAGRERTVAVHSGRTVELIIALLAVVRSGAAFVPVDPAQPAARQQSIIRDSRACLVLSDGATPLLGGPPRVLISARPAAGAGRRALPAIHPDQAAYILYTSGSTGTPKGVVISHRALSLYLDWAAARYGCAGPALLPTSPAVDLSLTALFVPLLVGGSVRLVGDDDLARLAELLRARHWALLKLTPTHLSGLEAMWTASPAAAGPAAGLDTLIVGGEALRRGQVRRWLDGPGQPAVYNEYGPTETTVGCCVHEVGPADPDAVPIGAPVPHASAALLAGEQAAGPGEPGELLIGGGAVARGYLGRPALTAASFVPDPAARGARRYRTGDLASRDGRGRLSYHGRLDRQLKIRGHRVEPGEVESALRSAPGVAGAAVHGEPAAGRMRLVGYVVPRPGARLAATAVRAYLAERLPAYLVPSRLSVLPALPMTASGKTDYASLRAAAAVARLEVLSDEQAAEQAAELAGRGRASRGPDGRRRPGAPADERSS
jgi:nonribosomal peptide synthetase protein BlmVI